MNVSIKGPALPGRDGARPGKGIYRFVDTKRLKFVLNGEYVKNE